MTTKKTTVELRQEVLNDDAKRDVNITIAFIVAGMAMLSSAAGTLAVISIFFLSSFRKDVEDLWLSCIPLCFTFVTGVAVGYRKQMADVGVHIALAMTTLLAGGAGYGLSVEPVYLNRENCTVQVDYHGDCNREVLTTIYFIAGAVASGFAVLGLLMSCCACSNAMSRRARREKYKQMRLEYEENRRKGEVRDQKRLIGQPTHSPPASTATTSPTSNGTQQSKLNGLNGVNGTSKSSAHTPLQNTLVEPFPKPPLSLPPQIIEEEEEEECDIIEEEREEEQQQQQPEVETKQPEVKKEDQSEVVVNHPEVTKETPKMMTTTIIVREAPVERKRPASVDRGTQVNPDDHVVEVEPAKKDVGVSPYQEVDGDDVQPEGNDEGDVSGVLGEKIRNEENEKASKVMTHL